jgi:hypothetical protein
LPPNVFAELSFTKSCGETIPWATSSSFNLNVLNKKMPQKEKNLPHVKYL